MRKILGTTQSTKENEKNLDEPKGPSLSKLQSLIQELSPLPNTPLKTKINKSRKRGQTWILNTTPEIKQKKVEEEENIAKEQNRKKIYFVLF